MNDERDTFEQEPPYEPLPVGERQADVHPLTTPEALIRVAGAVGCAAAALGGIMLVLVIALIFGWG